jgi:hypothetical protein
MQPKPAFIFFRFVGHFEPCWKEKGTVRQAEGSPEAPKPRVECCSFWRGGALCIHQSRLMAADEQKG